MSSFKKYKVQKGETIEDIADKIGIPVQDIRAFHNQHCDISDLVEIGLPLRFVDYILLPNRESYVDSKLSEQNAIKKVFSNSENTLRLTSIKNLKLEYGTIIYYRENNRLKNKVHFTSQVEFLRDQNGFFIVSLQINQVYVNDQKPNLVIEEFADTISKVLYPITLCLTNEGKIHSILNIKDIQERWKKLKPSMLDYYTGGKQIEKLIVSFEKNIGSASLLKRSFEEHIFCQTYFVPIYQKHSSDLLFFNTDFQTKTFQSVDEFETSTNKICVKRKGMVSNLNLDKNLNPIFNEIDLSKKEFETNIIDEGFEKNIDFEYRLHHFNNTIFSITGFINTRISENTIATIEIETYQINSKKEKKEILNPISKNIDWNSQIINENDLKEPGFWEKFWGR